MCIITYDEGIPFLKIKYKICYFSKIVQINLNRYLALLFGYLISIFVLDCCWFRILLDIYRNHYFTQNNF